MNKQPFWKYAISGGNSKLDSVIIHAGTVGMVVGTWIISQAPWIIYTVAGGVQVLYWYGTWKAWKQSQQEQ